ncbi:IS5 family transposase domain protein (plasmid) [Candidatus Trichorickettsia mobilis]|uniref:hypothetical protein n=1 Tax=Candidatus Trichorickettsia mobilis TaxID=1346319 RepID=UPI002B260A3B|nr:hypothetical protein [Candidatus Trichorickettsia mobilis]WPY01685.1 IS5 family transposase domain protein [Candidatus Trichorickettsia mobilis]
MEKAEQLCQARIIAIIPSLRHAVIDPQHPGSWHNRIVQYIKDKGSVYAFHKKYCYGKRALIESQNSRIKRGIGNSLLTPRQESQITEGKIIANIINLWNLFGQCNSIKIG